MFGKKQDLPKPKEEKQKTKREKLDEIKADLERHYKELEDEEEISSPKEEILPKIPTQEPETDQKQEISNIEVLQALRELYQLLSNRFDQIYFKIDQTQDLLINTKNSKNNKK